MGGGVCRERHEKKENNKANTSALGSVLMTSYLLAIFELFSAGPFTRLPKDSTEVIAQHSTMAMVDMLIQGKF